MIGRTITWAILFLLAQSGIAICQEQRASPDQIVRMAREAEREAKFFFEEARKRNAYALGSALSTLDIQKHTCKVLSLLLGKARYTSHFKGDRPPKLMPRMSQQELEEVQIYALSKQHFAEAAQHVLVASEKERILRWNLQCVGHEKISSEAAIETSNTAAVFHVEGTNLRVLGNIETGFAETLAKAVADNPEIQTISLGSAGGSVADAIKAGAMIRTLGLSTELWNNCYSACVLVFLGGVKRAIWSPYPDLGFHQASIYGKDLFPGSPLYQTLSQYVAAMGANPKFVISSMFAATSEQMFVPKLDALCRNGVVTWVQRTC